MLSQKRVVINVVDTGRQQHFRKFPYFQFVGNPEVIAPALSLCGHRHSQIGSWHSGRFSKGSGDSHNLSDDLSIVVIPQLLLWLIGGRERMNHQRAVLETAASA